MAPLASQDFEHALDLAFKTFLETVETPKDYQTGKSDFTFEAFLHNKLLIVHAIRKGLPYQIFELVAGLVPLSMGAWAVLLNTSTKSLQRYRQNQTPFKPIHSEKIIELAEVAHLGIDVFGSSDAFGKWLETPSYALGSLCPIDLLRDSYGKELVIGELHRIDQGILS